MTDRATIYHGTPLTPRAALVSVCTGRAMCVSFCRLDIHGSCYGPHCRKALAEFIVLALSDFAAIGAIGMVCVLLCGEVV